MKTELLIGIVGPCSAGKSELARRLREAGCRVREIRQEHSGVPTMWRRLTDPDILIYLDVSIEAAMAREKLSRPPAWWVEERERRLRDAREHCDLYIDTSAMTPEEVFRRVRTALEEMEAV